MKGTGLVLLGVFLALLSFLLLTTTPGVLYRFAHRAHYRAVEVEVQGVGMARSIAVKIRQGGETLRIRRSTFEGMAKAGAVFPAWHDADARLTLGVEAFDERIVSGEPYHGLPGIGEVLALMGLQVGSGLGAFLLLRGASVPS